MKKKIEKIFSSAILLFFGRLAFARFIGVKIGENCRIITTKWGTEPFLITIGNNVTVTAGVSFLTHDGSAWLMRDAKGRRYLYQPIQIHDNVFIGINSLIMPGVKIESNVIVAAGSVVTKSVPSGSVIAGVPARIIGSYSDLEKKMLDSYISDNDINMNIRYKERITKVVKNCFKDYLN